MTMPTDARAQGSSNYAAAFSAFLFRLAGWLAYIAIFLPLFFIWVIRNEGHLTPESGIGYWLGIAGVTATVLLLTYPLRKRFRIFYGLGGVKNWFRVHMFLGVLAPVLILAHCNFSLGSLNSQVALFSMLTVAISGIAGRYFYSRIHFGLYGTKATLKDLQTALADDSGRLADTFALVPSLQKSLMDFTSMALTPVDNLALAAVRAVSIGIRARWARLTTTRAMVRELKREAKRAGWPPDQRRRTIKVAKELITDFLGTVRRAAQLSFYERLFALWHVLHIPLFYMLLLAVCVHIFAVHVY